jgi:hypothetical protein
MLLISDIAHKDSQQFAQNKTLFNNSVPGSEDYCVMSKYKQGADSGHTVLHQHSIE